MKHKFLIKWIVFLLLGVGPFTSSWGQTFTQTKVVSLNTKKAQKFKHDHGFIINTTQTDWTVTMEVKTVKVPDFFVNTACNIFTTPTKNKAPLRIYAADADPSLTPTGSEGFVHTRSHVNDYFKSKLGGIYCIESAKADSREYYSKQAIIAKEFINFSLLPFRDSHRDVEVTLTVTGGLPLDAITKIKIPGVSDLSGLDFQDDLPDLIVDNYRESDIDHNSSQSFDFDNPDNAGTLDFIMGDSVVFRSKHHDFNFQGLSEVWLARSAGESKYYCTESVNPGDIRPFLGYDSQVHGVAFREYPEGFETRHSDAIYDTETNLWTWSWIAQRRTESSKTTFNPNEGNAPLEKIKHASNFGRASFPVGGGQTVVSQRNNQREGYNMQLLDAFTSLQNGYQNYNVQHYILGLDEDEIVYLNSNIAEINSQHAPVALLQAEVEEWKLLPEGPTADPVVVMADAYRKNRAHRWGLSVPNNFAAYEILDKGTYNVNSSLPTRPFNGKAYVQYKSDIEIANDNNKGAGGLVSFSNGTKNMTIPMNVKLQNDDFDFGFDAISGELWPAENQNQVPYTIIIPENTNGGIYTMEYTYENELGQLSKDARTYQGNPTSNKGKIWVEKFDMHGWGYHEITVYYQRKSGATRVPVAGKELLDVNMRFVSAAGSDYKDFSQTALPGVDLNEGRGEGKYWYLRDFNNFGDAQNSTYGNRDYSVSRTYTFAQGDEVSFSAMDSDPHTFLHYKDEFYLSERTMAKRLLDEDLESRIKWYRADINFPNDRVEISSGRICTYTWDSPGSYILTAVYNDASEKSHIINVTEQLYENTDESVKGEINIYELSPTQKQYFADSEAFIGDPNNLRVAEVENIFSEYTHVDGPRALPPNGKPNRYGLEKDFNNHFFWESNGEEIPAIVPTNLDRRENWFPVNWIRHLSGSDPYDDMDATITANLLKKTPQGIDGVLSNYVIPAIEPWQWRLPWISTTEWSGYRTRVNIKAIYIMKEFFDNDRGAFSGVGNANYEDDPSGYAAAVSNSMPSLTDKEKFIYDFHLDLTSGRKVVYDPTEIKTPLVVYNYNEENVAISNYIAGKITDSDSDSDFIKGADMSSIKNLEAKGIKWGNTAEKDPYTMIKNHDIKTVRFRLWVDPVYGPNITGKAGQPYPYSQLSSVKDEIIRAKGQGHKIILDLHLSDTWTDPEKNIIPAAWKVDGMIPSTTVLSTTIDAYVHETLETLEAANALPDYIQIGNETNSNILLSAPYANLTVGQIAAEIGVGEALMNGNKFMINWDRNAALLNAALGSVYNFRANSNVVIETILHIAGPSNAEYWIDQATFNNGRDGLGTATVDLTQLDMLAMSYYPGEAEQKESIQEVKQIIERIKMKHNIPVLIVETGFPQTYDFSDNTDNIMGQQQGTLPATVTPEDQKNWLESLIATLRQTDGSNGLVYWEPFWVGSNNNDVPMIDTYGSTWENMSFFKFESGTPNEGLNLLDTNGGITAFCEGVCPDANMEFIASPNGNIEMSSSEVELRNEEEIQENLFEDLNVFPNPSFDGNFTVEFGLGTPSDVIFEIRNTNGQLMYNYTQSNVESGNHRMLLGNNNQTLTSGMYLLTVRTNGVIVSKKLIVQ